MKKFLLLFLFVLFIPAIACAQLPLVYQENFENNDNEWFVKDNDIVSAKIAGGMYYLNLKSTKYSYRFWNKIYDLSSLQEYRLVFCLRQVTGTSSDYYGVLFDSDDADNCNEFKFNSSGEYYIDRREDKEYHYMIDTRNFVFIKPKGECNIIEIHKHDGVYDFYINSHLAERISVRRMAPSGDNIGFYLGGQMVVKVDYVKVYGTKAKLNIVASPVGYEKQNLGDSVNSEVNDLHPLITADGKTLYFVRDAEDFPKSGYAKDDEIWQSTLVNGKWTKAKKMPAPFNDKHNNGLYYVSPDKSNFIVSGAYDNGIYLNSDGLSMIRKTRDGWSQPNRLIISDIYNDSRYYSYCLSSDRKYLILSIQRNDDTYGKRDLYVSFLQDDGTYTAPLNLGPQINTSLNDGTPFLAADNRTLYFSSYGHAGYGSADIFVSYRLDDTWQHWSEPQNLGPSVNTKSWDAYFTLDSRGEYAYFVSYAQGSIGGSDIYRIKLSGQSRPDPVAVVRGRVVKAGLGEHIGAKVIYYIEGAANQSSNTVVADSGRFKILLPLGRKYTFYAEKSGYLSDTKVVDLTDSLNYCQIVLTLDLEKLRQGQSFTLKNIYFPAASPKFLPQSYPELNRLVMFLKQNPNIRVCISGHTNNIGTREELVELSLKRAQAVENYLVEHGIDESRLEIKGYGPSRPIADNSTPEGRRLNQRVEVEIIK